MILNDTSFDHSSSDQLLAAMCHITAIIPLMGVIIPILVWVTQHNKSKYLAFQAVQAAAFQLLMVLFLILSFGCQILSIFPTLLMIPLQGSSSGLTSFVSVIAGIFSFLSSAFSCITCLAFPLAILYALMAAVSVFRGNDFHYMILGHRIDKYLNN